MANFFIRRPIFAWVLAIILMMAGVLAILQLPVAQYPTIAPPAVSISANYPGADAQTVQDTVTQVIEQNMNGIDNLMYMSSTSDSAGSVTNPDLRIWHGSRYRPGTGTEQTSACYAAFTTRSPATGD